MDNAHKENLTHAGTMCARAMFHNDATCAKEWTIYANKIHRFVNDPESREIYRASYAAESARLRGRYTFHVE